VAVFHYGHIGLLADHVGDRDEGNGQRLLLQQL
jgi:hypothetical protein